MVSIFCWNYFQIYQLYNQNISSKFKNDDALYIQVASHNDKIITYDIITFSSVFFLKQHNYKLYNKKQNIFLVHEFPVYFSLFFILKFFWQYLCIGVIPKNKNEKI